MRRKTDGEAVRVIKTFTSPCAPIPAVGVVGYKVPTTQEFLNRCKPFGVPEGRVAVRFDYPYECSDGGRTIRSAEHKDLVLFMPIDHLEPADGK